MTDSNLYGHQDRRKNTPASGVFVGERFNQIFAEHGYNPRTAVEATEKQAALEQAAVRAALRDLDAWDQRNVLEAVEKLKWECKGVAFGDTAAMQVICRVGIFLSMADEESRGQW